MFSFSFLFVFPSSSPFVLCLCNSVHANAFVSFSRMENSQYLPTTVPISKSDDDFENQNSNFSASSSLGSKFSDLATSNKNGTVLIEQLQKKVELLDQKLFDIQNLTLLKVCSLINNLIVLMIKW